MIIECYIFGNKAFVSSRRIN